MTSLGRNKLKPTGTISKPNTTKHKVCAWIWGCSNLHVLRGYSGWSAKYDTDQKLMHICPSGYVRNAGSVAVMATPNRLPLNNGLLMDQFNVARVASYIFLGDNTATSTRPWGLVTCTRLLHSVILVIMWETRLPIWIDWCHPCRNSVIQIQIIWIAQDLG